VVAHLRLGDSFCATTAYARDALRPLPPRDVAAVVQAALLADAISPQQKQQEQQQQPQPPASSVSAASSSAPSEGQDKLRRRPAAPNCTIVYSAHGGCLNATSAYVTELMGWLDDGRQKIATAAPAMNPLAAPLVALLAAPLAAPLAAKPSRGSSATTGCVLDEGAGWRAADRHLCAMVNARALVQGSGGFSYLAERVRARRSQRAAAAHDAGGGGEGGGGARWPTWQALVRTPIVWLDARQELAKRQADDAAKLQAKS
jgi:hypothetical protein